MRRKELIIPTLSFALMMSAGMTANTTTLVYADTINAETSTTTVETNKSSHISKQTIKKLNKTMYATTAVNVRNKPSSKGKKLGTLRFAQKVKVTGQDKNTGWYRITYKGKIGYVSGSYLSTSKPSSGSTSKPSSGSTSKPSNGGSTSKPSTGKPSTSKPSKPSTSKPSNDSMYETDCATGADDWLSGKADCDELEEGSSWW